MRHLDKFQPPFIAYKKSLAPEEVRKESVFDFEAKLRFEIEDELQKTLAKFLECYPNILGIEGRISALRGSAPNNYILSAAEIKIDLSPDVNNPKQIE